jgi:hypothetical protein
MKAHRRFCYKATAVCGLAWLFALLAVYSYNPKPLTMDELHARVEADYQARHNPKRQAIMDLWNIQESDLAKPVDLFNERNSL